MATLRDMLNSSARLINIVQQNEVLSGDNLDVAMYALQTFVDSTSNNRLLVYGITEFVFPLTGQQSYTLGVGGDWNIPRPMRVELAYARLNDGSPQQLDIAMQPLTVTQFAGIAVKNTTSTFPFAFYDNNAYPLRTVTLFPIPSGPAAIVLWLREPLIDLQQSAIVSFGAFTPGTGYTNGFYPNVPLGGSANGTGAKANFTIKNGVVTECVLVEVGTGYAVGDVLVISNISVGGSGSGFSIPVAFVSATLDDPIDFPPGYERFFRFNLAVELAAEFGKVISDQVLKTAFASKKELETLNAVPTYVRGDGGMSRNGRNRYFNWITGNFWSFGNN